MSFSTYIPLIRTISAITQGFPTIITTDQNHGYNPGLIARIVITYSGSMPEINNKFGILTILSPNTFSMQIDSRNYAAFVPAPNVLVTAPPPAPPPFPFLVPSQHAQVIPIAEINQTLINAVDNVRV